MSTMYESLMASLTEEVNDIKKHGRPQGRRTTLEITPVTRYTAARVKSVRLKTGSTQEKRSAGSLQPPEKEGGQEF